MCVGVAMPTLRAFPGWPPRLYGIDQKAIRTTRGERGGNSSRELTNERMQGGIH